MGQKENQVNFQERSFDNSFNFLFVGGFAAITFQHCITLCKNNIYNGNKRVPLKG